MTLFRIIGFVLFSASIATSTPNRMVRGNITNIEKYPYIASVEVFRHGYYWMHTCTASILTARFVLSAAQCFIGREMIPRYIRIRAGTSELFQRGMVVYVENIINHPNYCHRTKRNDISMVKLMRALPSLPTIQQATIVAHGTKIPDNLLVDLVGWGFDSKVLRNMTVYTVNNKLCAQQYAKTGFKVTGDMICSGILDHRRDLCRYDIGGPMLYKGILIGVNSKCVSGHLPLVSTSVTSYTNWITKTAH
ncbi:unnamed protein product [Euphydryas editha]|uniref:Peptidase S1 domain-containing protein n=1 Tax=Euphydryas editha TaxID=104508 RepID=A0AAU9UBB6_EUPED|nr:unnamed protein product [Euphydryas editha]